MEFDKEVLHFCAQDCNEKDIIQIIEKLKEYGLDVVCHRHINDFEFFVIRDGFQPVWSNVQFLISDNIRKHLGYQPFSLMQVHIVVQSDNRTVFKNYGTGKDVVVEENFGG